MKPKNRYFIGSHLSEKEFLSILKEFCLDSPASETSLRTGISRKTVNGLFMLFRQRIFDLSLRNNKEKIGDEVEIDESYFGARRIRGKRGRGALGKIPVFGILKNSQKEEDLLDQLVDIVRKVSIKSVDAKEKLQREVVRYRNLTETILKRKSPEAKLPKVDFRDYARYVLREGTREEKREILSCLKTTLTLQNQIVSIR